MTIDFVFPKFKMLSGAERLILGVGDALAERGHRVRLLCHSFHPSCRGMAGRLEVVETGARLDWTGNHYLDSIVSYLRSPRLRRDYAKEASVVCLYGPALPLTLGPRRPGRPVAYFCFEPPRASGVDQDDVLERVGGARWLLAPALRGWRAVDRFLVRRADAVLVSGPFAQELIQAEYGLASAVLTPGISHRPAPESRGEARRRLGLPPEAPISVTVNFLHPRKRIDLSLRAWVEVERRLPGATLVVVGDGPERAALEALARELGLRGVRFAGFVADDDVPRFYAAANLLVHTARQETFGLTVIEAGALGTPALTVDEGGPRWTILDGETGRRVPATPEALAAAMIDLLGDPARLAAMGERARAHVLATYRWSQAAEDFLAVCRGLGVGA